MARIVYSALVDSIKGSIGGTTFQGNAYGYTVKKKPNIIHPATSLQNRSKALMSRATRAWRDLTDTQRGYYNTYASVYPQYAKNNPSSQLSGYAVFVKWHVHRFLSENGVDTGPLAAPPATDSLTYSIINDGSSFKISITSTTDDEAWIILFFASAPFGDAQNFIGTKTRFIGDSTNADQTNTFTDQYTGVWGAVPSVGDRVALDALLIGSDAPKVLARDSDIYTVAAS